MSRPWSRLGLRARLLALGVLGLVLGFALGGALLLGALGWTLQRSVDAEALRTADAVALLTAEDALPDPLPVAGGQLRVQVVDAQGRIRAASIDADRLVPMLGPDRLRPGQRQRLVVDGRRVGMSGPVRVVTVPAGTPAEPRTVLVAKSLSDVRHSLYVVRNLLFVGFPLLVAGLAVVAWRVVGATLRPVEELRSGAAEITGRAGAERLPVPAGQDEIHRLAVTLNDMLDRLAASRDRQRAFVADAAHELRSPLTNMRTALEVARRLGDDTDWPAVADDLLADTERLSRLVDDLLLLARLDEQPPPDRRGRAGAGQPEHRGRAGGGGPEHRGRAGGGGPESQGRAGDGRLAPVGPVELGELLRGVAARYPSPPLWLTSPDGARWTEGDPGELRRVLVNLVENALRHADNGVELAVSGPDGPYHLVTVTDDGPGIPAADRERVFARFTRLDDARARDAGGAGLGLAIVRELVRRAGGTVELADATPGAAAPGLRVTVRLPVLADGDPE
ncbi:HAMP domain-containing sensor histidine kinase [Micromonospora sp. WMMD975]|uniref:sensor histidine kinase n=1 Tax=Micromonospora sp. WMMD975 TaxID=3016087 RepID=UPI00249BAC7C|nr:HAMP domain-containing sensor histidine kinase [Micromonospora sp. WMMD975]WFE34540.1 HAMP domain-containing sensor histidine kinase [Micromonospora sp. WMMD975]